MSSRTGAARDAGGFELLLDRAPDRLLGGLRAVLARLVLGVDGRQPDDAGTAPGGDLDRLRVQPADAVVERDRAESAHLRHDGANDRRALGRRRIVRLEHEAGQAELGEATGQAEVVDAPGREIRLDVDVQVVGAADELARASGRLSGLRRRKQRFLLGHRWGAFDVEGRDRLHPPRLSLGPLRLRPDDGLVIRRVDQVPTGGDLDAVSPGSQV